MRTCARNRIEIHSGCHNFNWFLIDYKSIKIYISAPSKSAIYLESIKRLTDGNNLIIILKLNRRLPKRTENVFSHFSLLWCVDWAAANFAAASKMRRKNSFWSFTEMERFRSVRWWLMRCAAHKGTNSSIGPHTCRTGGRCHAYTCVKRWSIKKKFFISPSICFRRRNVWVL